MTLDQYIAVYYWLPLMVLVVGIPLALCVVCFVSCWAMQAWHKFKGATEGYKTLCERVAG